MSNEDFGKPLAMKFTRVVKISSVDNPNAPGASWRLSEETLREIEELEAWQRRGAFNARFLLLD